MICKMLDKKWQTALKMASWKNTKEMKTRKLYAKTAIVGIFINVGVGVCRLFLKDLKISSNFSFVFDREQRSKA